MKTKAENMKEKNQMFATGKPAAVPSNTEQIAAINTRQGREMEKAIGPVPVDFDAAAMEAELEAVRQKHLKGVQDMLADFESKRAELDVEIDRLRGILGLGIGRKKTGRATARLSDEARAKAEADAIAFVAENTEGVGRSAAMAKLALDKVQTGRLLKGLVAAGKLRKDGAGSAVRYFAA